MILRVWIISFAAVFLLVINAGAMTLDGGCSIRFFGQSTLHDFDGQVACQPFIIQTEEGPTGRQVVQLPVVTVRVSEMNTDNTSRDKKMWAMFDHEHFPEIKGHFVGLDHELTLEQLTSSENDEVSLEFDLQIRDTRQHIKAKTSVLTITPEQIVFIMEFPLSLASFELKPPSVMGIIRVADEVRVEVQTTLQSQEPLEVSAAVKER